MASTSPYTPNDYQAASNYRPYELPVNDIYKAITAQNQFWEQGASRIKNVYESALNLDLTLNENIQMRNEFMEKAQKQLTKLSSMDVSDPSVQKQGFGIFKPLLRDEGIIYDDYLTKKRKEVFADADKWKNDEKTKGEGFHMDNLAFALRGFKGFDQTTQRDALGDIYKSAKDASYTPYYDQSKERMTLLDKCKPDVVSNTTTQGMYLETDKRKVLSSQKLWGCLEAGLTDKARQQNRISGIVRYGDDYNALRNDYIETAADKREYYNEQVKDLSAQLAAVKGKAGYENYSKGLQDQIDQYSSGMAKLDKDLTEYGTWDEEYMKKNYDDLASTAYFKRSNGAFAEAFATRDIEQSKKADPVGMMYYTQKKLDERQEAAFTHDEKMEDYKMRLKLLSGESGGDEASRLKLFVKMGGDPSQFQSVYGTAEEEKGDNYSVISSNIKMAEANISAKAKEIIAFAQKSPELAKVVGDVGNIAEFAKNVPKLENYIRLALKTNPNDVQALDLKDGLNAYVQMLNEKTHKQSILDDAHTTVTGSNKQLFADYDTKLKSIRPKSNVSLSNGEVISPDRVEQIASGADPRYSIVKGVYSENFSGTGGVSGGQVNANYVYDKATGKKIYNSAIDKYVIDTYNITDSKRKEYVSKIDKYLGERTAVQKMKLAAGNILGKGKISGKPDEMTPAMSFVSGVFGSTLGGDVTFNTIGGYDPVDGWVDVQAVDSKNKSISSSDLMSAAQTSGYGAGRFEESKKENSIRLKIPYLENITPAPAYSETISDLMNYASQRVTKENLPQGLVLDAGITPTGEKIQLKTTKSLASGAAKHTIMVNGSEIPIKIGNDAATAMSYIGKLLSGEIK